jgi:rubrerythrin
MRYLPTNVLVTNFEYQAPDLYTAEQHMTWTKEALERMDRVPGFVVGMATGAVIRYAIEKGYTVITTGVIDEVIKNILPPGAMESMRAIGDQMRAAQQMGEDAPIESLFKDFDERTKGTDGTGHKNGSANGTDQAAKEEIFSSGAGGFGRSEDQGDVEGISEDVQEEIRRSAQGRDRFECDVCRYVAKGKPAKCPVCGAGPTRFHAVDAEIATADETEGDLNLSEVYDGRELHWTDDAKGFLDALEEWQEKRRVRARVEKSALKKGYTTITREYAEQQYREETGREAPEVKGGGCPVSHAKQNVGEASGGKCPIDHSAFQKAGNLVPEGGSREFTWTQEAIERLERAPKGFMRNISRNMTEKLARERGTTRIDLALVEDSLAGARNTMEDVITGKISIADLVRDTGEKIEAENGEAPHPPMTTTMVCTVCGEELQGVQPPDECPVCGSPPEDFEAK